MVEAQAATRRVRQRTVRLLLLGAWAALVLVLAWHHVPWRDEVRAFGLAIQGENLLAMLRGVQGEGHPALWYLLLRIPHDLVPVREVLPAMALLVAALSMLILVLKSPLRTGTVALFMFGGLGLFEYAVSARNYGMGMLILFAVAALYPRWRDRGLTIGLLLALLCNTSVPAAFLAAALVGFWLVELLGEEGLRPSRKYGWWLANAAVAAAGAAICFVTVFPTVNDAASIDHPGGITISTLLEALGAPAFAFHNLAAPSLLTGGWADPVITILLIGSLAGLVRAPGAFLAGLAGMLVLQLFFQIVYPGAYRHQGLLIVFLLTLNWLANSGRGGRWPNSWRLDPALKWATRIGGGAFAILLALQLAQSVRHLSAAADNIPYSRAADLAALLEREQLTDAILIADPDVMLEAVPYHAGNPTYLLREQKFGRFVRFTLQGRLDIRLDDVLADARRLAAESRRPVVILMRPEAIDSAAPPQSLPEPYGGRFRTDPGQVARFLSQTRKLAAFGEAVTDESYEVYLFTGG